MNTYVIQVHNDIRPLEAQWRALEASGVVTAFQCYGFVAPLYATFVKHGRAEPLIVVVRATAGEPPLMILPLCRVREGNTALITFADLRVADYCAPILARGFPSDATTFARIWRAVCRALPPCDAIRLRKLPERIDDIPNPLLRLRALAPYQVQAHGIAVAHPWSEASAKVMSSRHRNQLRRHEKHLNTEGPISFRYNDGGPVAEQDFATLLGFRLARFAALGRDDAMADPMWVDFYTDLVHGKSAQPFARIMTLTSGDSIVASALGLVHRNAYLLLIPAFDMERFSKYAPGRLLINRAISELTQQGITYFDLTIGDENYKQLFGVDNRDLFEIVQARSFRGLIYGAAWRAKVLLRDFPKVRDFLKRVLKSS